MDFLCLSCGILIFSNSLPFSLVMHGLPNCQKRLSHRRTPPPHKVTVLPPPTRAEAILLPTQHCRLATVRAATATLLPLPPGCRHCPHAAAVAAAIAALPPPLPLRRHRAADAAAATALLPLPPPTSSSYSSWSPLLSLLPLPLPLFKLIVDYCLLPCVALLGVPWYLYRYLPTCFKGSPTTRDSTLDSPTTCDSAIGSPTTRDSAIGLQVKWGQVTL